MHKYVLLLAIIISLHAQAQVGGQKSFEFLNVAPGARLSALGGVNASLSNTDLTFFMSNPSLITDSLQGWGSANYLFYVGDIGQASFAFAHTFNKVGTVNFGLQHIGYGEIVGYDETGLETGSFKSNETAIIIGKSHQVSNFRFGVNLKTVFSAIAGYRASAIMMDVGGLFVHPEREFTVGMVIKNFGFRASDYSETSKSKLPFDVQLGTTIKPEHMPVRFSITAFNLTNYRVFDDPTTNDSPGSLEKVFRHLNFGAEVLFHKNVNVLIGYNYLRRQELKTENGNGGAGIGIGLNLKIKSFDIVLSRGGYSVGNAGYSFSLATNVEQMFKRKEL